MSDNQQLPPPPSADSPTGGAGSSDEAVVSPPPSGSAAFFKGFAGGIIGGAVVSVAVAAAAFAFLPTLKNLALGPELLRLDAVEQSQRNALARPAAAPAMANDGLADRVAALEARAPALAGDDQRLGPAARRVEEMGAELSRTKAEVDALRKTIPPEGVLLHLADRTEQAEKAVRAVAQQQQSAQAMLLALGQLKGAIDRGDPYQLELRATKRFASADAQAALDSLAPNAANGVASRRDLEDRFPALADNIRQADIAPDDSLWNKIRRQAASIVSIRRIDGEGSGTDAVVARALQQVKNGDLAKAAAELGALKGAPADTAAPWVKAASARAAADRTLSELVATVAADTAARPGG